MKLSLVIPCFNEEGNVRRFFEETEKAFAGETFEYEYVFVNDGSKDGTLAELRRLTQTENANFRIVSFSRNFGKESAIFAGLSQAKGEYTTVIDADLQQRPEVVLQMIRLLEQKPEIDCVAAFQAERKEGKVLSFCKGCFYKLINGLTDVPFVNGASDFRTFRKPVRQAILSLGEYHRFSKGIFAWVGFQTEFIPYEVRQRESGSSKWSFIKLFKYAVEGIIAFTVKPLLFPTVVGGVFTAGSLIYYIVALILRLCGHPFSAFRLMIATIFFVGGTVLLSLGLIGEYLAKVYQQSKDRPTYLTKELITKDKEK